MKKALNFLLLLSFLLTLLVPLTGVHFHKAVSLLFLLLSVFHVTIYRSRMNSKRWLLWGLILLCFASGIAGMLFAEIPLLMALHKISSFALIFFLGIHLFLYRNRLK